MAPVRALKKSFIAGLLLIAPLVVTLFVLQIASNWLLKVVDPVVEGTRLTEYTGVEIVAQVVAFVLIVAAITFLGFLAQKSVGRRIFGNFGRVVNVIPLVSTIYTGVRKVSNSLVDRDTAYESVVLVEAPREGLYTIGLVTGAGPKAAERIAGEPVYNVYMPHSPNPTQGRLQLVPESQLHETDMSVRRGMRLVLTTGMDDGEPASLPELPAEELLPSIGGTDGDRADVSDDRFVDGSDDVPDGGFGDGLDDDPDDSEGPTAA